MCKIICLYQRKRQKLLYKNTLGLKQVVMAIPIVLTCLSAVCAKLRTVAVKDSNTLNLYSHLRSTHPEELLLVQCASNKVLSKKETENFLYRDKHR